MYLAAVVLNPWRKWEWINKRWEGRATWRADGRSAIKKLWNQYKDLPLDKVLPQEMDQELTGLAAFKRGCDDESTCMILDEYTYWVERVPRDREFKTPIAYWVAHRSRWPRLARLALDIYSIPAMSDEPERIFSLTGCMVTDR